LKSTHSVRAACSLARIIETRRALGDHAFLVRLLRLDELAFTKLSDLLAVVECAELNFTVPNGTFAARFLRFAMYRLWAGNCPGGLAPATLANIAPSQEEKL